MKYRDKVFNSYSKQEAINTCAKIVKPKMYKIALPEGRFVQEQLPDMFKTKWSKLLKDVDQNAFILGSFAKAMFKDEVDPQYVELKKICIAQVTPAKVSMIFGQFYNKLQQNKFVELIQSELGEGFVVMPINGDVTSNRKIEEEAQKVIAKAKLRGKKVILVSRDMASRSFSISEIDTVFLMYDNGILAQTIQKVSRGFTPGETYYGKEKEEAVIVTLSLDANREELDPIDQYVVAEASRIAKPEESLQDSIKRVAPSFNIFTNDINGLAIKINPDEYAEELITSSNLVKVAAATIKLENIDLNAHLDAVLDERRSQSSKREDGKVEVNIKKAKTFVDNDNEGEGKTLTSDEEKILIRNIIHLNNNIIVLTEFDSFENDNVLDIINSLENKGLKSEVEDYFGLGFDFIQKLIIDEVLSIRLLNTIIKSSLQRTEESAW
tara:strand:+ start:780 stop:2093 length:1314 start_codon:yes stop_codon:yes gene_type:complete